ncbi:MAG: hypothetical protein H7232_13170 [Aeromicrobium sp.]|nr:hypothetical protein [Burkholderiales bacterium]
MSEANDGQTIYLHTNILVSILTEDGLSATAIDWLDAQSGRLAISG